MSSSLMLRSKGSTTIPPLTRDKKVWARDSKSKADMLASVFDEKSQLPREQANEYSHIRESGFHMSGFLPVRRRAALAVLKHLDVESATGPDNISARVLKICADELAYPIARICRVILSTGAWPRAWCFHRIVPLHKRKSKSDPSNYRGVHITPQLSKVSERIFAYLFQSFLEETDAYGQNQYAYRRKHGHRDALAFNALQWLALLEKGYMIVLYLSDVFWGF